MNTRRTGRRQRRVVLIGLSVFVLCLVSLAQSDATPDAVSYNAGKVSVRYVPRPEKYGTPYGLFIYYGGKGVIEGSSAELHSPGYKDKYWSSGKNIPVITEQVEADRKIFVITETDAEIKYTFIQQIEISEHHVKVRYEAELSADSRIQAADQELRYGQMKTAAVAGCEAVFRNTRKTAAPEKTSRIPFDAEEAKTGDIVGWKNPFTNLTIASRAGSVSMANSDLMVLLGPYNNRYSTDYPSYFLIMETTHYKPGGRIKKEIVYKFDPDATPADAGQEQVLKEETVPNNPVTLPAETLKPADRTDLVFCAGNQAWQKEEASFRIPVLAVNDSPFYQEYPVQLTLQDMPAEVQSISLVDQAGFAVPFQKTGNEVSFMSAVKGHSWKSYYIYLNRTVVRAEEQSSMLTETEQSWTVDTGRIRAKFLKRPTGTFGPLYFLGSGQNNLLSDWQYSFMGARFWGFHSVVDGKILENGPVKVTIGYPADRPIIFFSLYRNMPFLRFKTLAGDKRNAVVWLDLYETTPTRMLYPTGKGTTEIPMVNGASGKYAGTPAPLSVDVQGNWVAFRGDRGMMGFIFDHKTHELKIGDMTNIQTVNLLRKKPGEFTEGMITVNDDPSVYAEKLCFPVRVLQMDRQSRKTWTQEKIPDYTRDFTICEWVNNLWGAQSSIFYETEDELHRLKLMGVNQIQLRFDGYYFWKTDFPKKQLLYDCLADIIDISHQHKVAVGGHIYPVYDESIWGKNALGSKFSFESTRWRNEYLAPKLRELCAYNLDYLFLADESSVTGESDDFRREYRERYGYECPEIADWKNADISDVKIFNRLLLTIEKYTDYCRWCNLEIGKYKPGLKTWVNQSADGQWPGGWSYPWTYVDPGRIMEAGTNVSIDPYFASNNRRRYEMRFLTAANHNRGALHIPGDTGHCDRYGIRRQMFLHPLFGGKSFVLFTVSSGTSETKSAEVQNFYYDCLWQVKNCLGPYIMDSQPVKFIAIPWSRDSWTASLKDGGQLKQYWTSAYDDDILNLACLTSVQWEYLFAEDIPTEIDKYPVVMIPQDKHISRDMMKQLAGYAGNGGILIFYGNAVEHETVRTLLGIKTAEPDENSGVIEGEQNILVPQTYALPELPEGTEVLAGIRKKNGLKPAVISRKQGKGRVIYAAFDIAELLKKNQRAANYLIKKVILSGIAAPVETDPLLEPVLFKGDGYYLLGIHNPGSPNLNSRVKVNGISGDMEVFDLLRGKAVPARMDGKTLLFSDTFDKEVTFYRISPENRFPRCVAVSETENFFLPLQTWTTANDSRETEDKKPGYAEKLRTARREGKICAGIVETPVKTADVLLESLRNSGDIFALKLDASDITPETLEQLDVLVFEAAVSGMAAPGGWADTVKKFVRNGGGVLLTHGAVGGIWETPLRFENIGTGAGKITAEDTIPTAEGKFLTGKMPPGKIHKHPYYDHFIIRQTGEKTVPVLRDNQENIIFLVGDEGKGRVALSGFIFGLENDDTRKPPDGWTRTFLLNVLKWLGENHRDSTG